MPYTNYQSSKKFVRPKGGKNYKRRKSVRNPKMPSMSKPVYRQRRYPMKRNRDSQKVYITLQNAEENQKYFSVGVGKVDNLTTNNNYTEGVLTDLSFPIANNPAFVKYVDTFRYVRCKGVRITLIPQTWNATTLTTGTAAPDLQNGEKPRIHFIHDVGETNAWLGSNSISITDAESFGKKCKEGQFTKPYKFWIKPLYKLENNVIPAGEGRQSWQSTAGWISTRFGFQSVANVLVPLNNLYYGFSAVPEDFSYKTIIEYFLVFKDLYYTTPPPPLAMMNKMSLNTVDEEDEKKEEEEEKENLNSLPPL